VADTPAASVLSDGTIMRLVGEGRIRIDPWDETMVQPASVDLRLGDTFRVFHNHRVTTIDLRDPPRGLTEEVKIEEEQPFVIHPGEFCLGSTAERVELPDDVVARIEGKALWVDTMVPSPHGWRTMGDLEVGDHVFAPDGQPVPVVATSEILEDRDCREVVFSDGNAVVADLSHQWVVHTRDDRRRGRSRIITTADMEGQLRCGKREDYRFHTCQASAVQYPERELPIDPYVLGVWLGDGTASNALVTCADAPILQQLELAGYAVTRASGSIAYLVGGTGCTRDSRTGRYTRNDSLSSRLRNLGLLGDKRIPRDYLQASIAQRKALLEGLMDTDGYVDVLGRCGLTTINARLADQYRELIASLGYRPVVAVKTATLYGEVCGLCYEVTFTPHERVFRLPRKRARQTLTQRFNFGRSIREINPTRSVPVRCIEVGSPEGTYLVTRAFIPTHNSSLGRLGLIVHATAGFCDPGWKGTLTLELNNLTRVPIKLYAGLPIAQLSFMTLDAPALRPYGHEQLGSHYQGQLEATESRYPGITPG
jgi:deoxycytidine triphosphate deaminase